VWLLTSSIHVLSVLEAAALLVTLAKPWNMLLSCLDNMQGSNVFLHCASIIVMI